MSRYVILDRETGNGFRRTASGELFPVSEATPIWHDLRHSRAEATIFPSAEAARKAATEHAAVLRRSGRGYEIPPFYERLTLLRVSY